MANLTRREFLALSAGLAVALATPFQGALAGTLVRTDPGCPDDAYAEILANFRRMRQGQTEPLPDSKRLRDGRAWLAGNEISAQAPGELAEWLEVPGPVPVKARVLRPAGPPQGVVLAIHGGGWAMGSAVSDERRNWALARSAQVVVVSPEYRLAPEHPFPAGPEDTELVARWLVHNARTRFGSDQLAILGGSAGSHLAALTLQRLSKTERQLFRCAVLFYGVYDLGRSEVWRSSTQEDFPDLSPEEMTLFLNWFIPGRTDEERRQALYSPLFGDLEGMPPALFLVGTADVLASDTLRMAEAWAGAGSAAELVEYPGAPHGFNGFEVKCGLDPDDYAADYIRRRITSGRS